MPALKLGPVAVDPPVVLAPMAGVTNVAYRRLCRSYGAGLTVSEMITARALVEGNAKTLAMAAFGEDEPVRSIQLCGVDPQVMRAAVGRLVDEIGVDHIDLNFGCPAGKVTRQGGGAALPAHRALFRAIVASAIDAAGSVPVTVKLRIGIDDTHVTFTEAGRIAEDEGAAGDHPARPYRRAALLGAGRLGGHRRAQVADHLHPGAGQRGSLGGGRRGGHGGRHRVRRRRGRTRAASVGRGCSATWPTPSAGGPCQRPPDLGEIVDMMRTHADLLCRSFGEDLGIRQFRKHAGWYLTGFRWVRRSGGHWARPVPSTRWTGLFGGLDPQPPLPPRGDDGWPGATPTGRGRSAFPPGGSTRWTTPLPRPAAMSWSRGDDRQPVGGSPDRGVGD